ncbi:winged helix-turn-helix domain-containing protein [Micromonospora sp. NPDC005413]|uniref:ArsR/SmtB family transcription factor n=1 Tax=Micromonospora sp. NPDC005413 TaxID=3154563 RepID=UPI0033A89473
MLRIHFTAGDLGRVRLAGEPDPLWETVLSLFRLRRPGPALVFGRWRGNALKASWRADLEVLMPLVRGAYYPDFLTPAEAGAGLSAGIEALRATPAARLRREMTSLAAAGGPAPSWLGLLAEGDRATVDRVAAAVRSHHDTVVAPFWPDARVHIDAERSRRAQVLLDQGTEGLLRSYRPMMTWEPPVLSVDVPHEQSLHLDGRGLLLVPSYLSWGTPDVLRDPALPPVLVYPIEHDLTLGAGLQRAPALAGLLGTTRAAALQVIADGCTTTGLAQRLGISPGGASQHATVLREAGLVVSHRHRNTVRHTLTPLGVDLLNAT